MSFTKPPPGLPPLALSQTETGALATAPLSTVVNSATDALYQDFYNLVHGDINIVSVAANASTAGGSGEGGDAANTNASTSAADNNAATSVEEKLTAAALGGAANDSNTNTQSTTPTAASANPNDAVLETRKQRMANLSFAQRRHELTRRIVQHTKSLAHVHALTASSLPKSHSAILQQKALKTHSSLATSSSVAKIHDPPPRLGATVQVSSDALQFVKSQWISQDEAQDALYFHHDGLWKARAHCHDVLGALCVLSTPCADDFEKNEDEMEVDGDGKQEGKIRSTKGVGGGGGRWPDFPTDVALAVDRYETSKEKSYSASELQARLASSVRRKLVLGEVGAFGTLGSSSNVSNKNDAPKTISDTANHVQQSKRTAEDSQPLPWRVVLGKGSGSIRLTYGTPRTVSTAEALRQSSMAAGNDDNEPSNLQQYPMEARLSVLSEDPSAPWKLLSIHARCSPKTGESDHQLVMNRKQMFDLHRIGERSMLVEEAVCRKANEEQAKSKEEGKKADDGGDVTMNDDNSKEESPIVVPRPLHRLFAVTHAFALSIQMEILSSQAEALRRGAWGGSMVASGVRGSGATSRGSSSALGECITVSPAYFFDQKGKTGVGDAINPAPIAVMAVHFWSCDDRYGSPRVGDLSTDNDGEAEKKEKDDASKSTTLTQQRDDNFLPKSDQRGDKRLSLCIRAVPTVGLVVSLSGGSDVVATSTNANDGDSPKSVSHHMQRNVDKLLSSIQDPFQLSMSDALLAATVLCADRRCQAVVGALIRQKNNTLPSWIRLEVECGTISVAAVISYPASNTTSSEASRAPTVLFRMACDSRTGRFVPVFPRPASLLRLLACNDPSASDVQALRGAAMASAMGGRSSSMAKRAEGASRESTGRIVRDAYDALSRSMETLGRKCGVGGEWNDIDAQSASLREKSIDQTCHDVRVSLMTCCGMAAVFGVAAMGLKIAGGADPMADVAGGLINDESMPDLLRVPPLSVMMRQRIAEKLVKEGDGGTKRLSQLQGELFSVSARVNEESLNLVCFDILTLTQSASSASTRLQYANVSPPDATAVPTLKDEDAIRPSKKPRTMNTEKCHSTIEEVEHTTLWLDTLLRQ